MFIKAMRSLEKFKILLRDPRNRNFSLDLPQIVKKNKESGLEMGCVDDLDHECAEFVIFLLSCLYNLKLEQAMRYLSCGIS